MTETQRAAMQAALQLCDWINESPHERGSINGLAAQAGHALRAALAEPDGVQGWKLVPLTPTDEMLATTSWPGCAAADYAHMLSAAPPPPRREWQSLTEDDRGVNHTDGFDYYETAALAEPTGKEGLQVAEHAQTTPTDDQLNQILDGLNRCHVRESARMFLRDWIRDWTDHKIRVAPAGMLSASENMSNNELARYAYDVADAMLKARES